MIERQPWMPDGGEHPPGQISNELKLRTWLRSPAMWALILGTAVSIVGGVVFLTYASHREPNGARDPLDVQHSYDRP